MKSITKIINGLVGFIAVGLLTYYVVTKDKNMDQIEKPITSPDQDTVATALVIKDTIPDRIKNALSIDGDEFTLTEDEGVYINSTKDKMLVIQEDIWEKIIRKTQKKFPNIATSCDLKYKIPDLTEYKFVGLLTHFADSKSSKKTSAYQAIEIKKGNAKSFAGGNICCDCEGGEPLVPQQVDAVIIK